MPRHTDVMVSSTSLDLPKHRDAAMDAIWRKGMFPLVMETGTATTGNAIHFSLQMVDDAEVYVGIFGFRYGYRPVDPDRNPDNLSITEMEYRRALERKIPVLIFLMADDHPIPVNVGEAKTFLEPNPDSEAMLNRLKTELKTKHVCGFFKSADELKTLVYQALDKLCADKIVDCDGDAKPAEPTDKALTARTLPSPPKPYVAHDYILTRQFVGRRSELKQLDEWAASADTTLIVDAIGGIGKSALTWQWFTDHAKDFEASFWWSFYESDSAVTNFTRHALAYLQGKAVKDYDGTSAEERERELLAILRKRRCLFVLDGLERILTAYHRMDAPHLLDEHAETDVPAAAGPITDPAQLRRCTDPRHAELLKKLTQAAPSKFLISTRLIPADLQDAGNLIPKVRELHLNGLADPDALALLKHLGVRGDGAQIVKFTKQFDNHSLLLGIIAGRVNEYEPAPGNFDRWYADEGHDLRLHDVDLKQRRTNILAYALAGLPPEQRKLLAQIAAFRYPVDYATVSAFNPYAPPRPVEVKKPSEPFSLYLARRTLERASTDAERTTAENRVAEEETKLAEANPEWKAYQEALAKYPTTPEYREGERRFRTALRMLQGRGLLQFDKEAGRYDLHPVVRAFAFEDLQGDDKRGTYERIRDHFEKLPPENLDEVQELNQLRRSLEIYHSLVSANSLEQAMRFFDERLADVLNYQLAAYPVIVELLTPLLPILSDEFGQTSSRNNTKYQIGCITHMAAALSYLGKHAEITNLMGQVIKLDLLYRNYEDVHVGLANYAAHLRDGGKLAEMRRASELALQLAEVNGDAYRLTMSRLYLMKYHLIVGDYFEGESIYQFFVTADPEYLPYFWRAEAEWLYAALLTYQGKNAASILESALEMCVAAKNIYGQRTVRHLQGEFSLHQSKFTQAIEYFKDAITLAQRSGLDTQTYSGGLARAYTFLGTYEDAKRLMTDGVDDISAAEVYMAMGERDQAGERAVAAYKAAWADGEPYVWRWQLERAKKVLAALGIAPPEMPPFDPAKVEPIPYEKEILAFIEELKAEKAQREAEEAAAAVQAEADDSDTDEDTPSDS